MKFLSIILICGITCFGFEMKAHKASGGEEHTLVEVATSDLWSCGDNSFGQLGVGDNNYREELEQVLSGEQNTTPDTFLTDITYFDAGWKHSIACDNDGYCWTWGSNANFCLGIGNTFQPYSHPVQVLSGQQSDPCNPHTYLENIIQVSAGRSGTHSLAIEDETGRCLSWGNNNNGQLGVGDSYSKPVPQLVLCGEQNTDPNGYPYFVNAVDTSAGEFHSMILDSNGNTFCMGNNGSGQIGDNLLSENTTVPIKVLAGEQSETNTYLENIIAISAGWNHCMALEALDPADNTKNGRLFTWGSNIGAWNGTGGGKLFTNRTQCMIT